MFLTSCQVTLKLLVQEPPKENNQDLRSIPDRLCIKKKMEAQQVDNLNISAI